MTGSSRLGFHGGIKVSMSVGDTEALSNSSVMPILPKLTKTQHLYPPDLGQQQGKNGYGNRAHLALDRRVLVCHSDGNRATLHWKGGLFESDSLSKAFLLY